MAARLGGQEAAAFSMLTHFGLPLNHFQDIDTDSLLQLAPVPATGADDADNELVVLIETELDVASVADEDDLEAQRNELESAYARVTGVR